RGLRDHVEALVLAVGPVVAEALHGEIDQPWVQGRQRVIAEAHLFHPAGRLVLGHHVGLLDHVEEHGLSGRVLEVERDALLVGVEQEEVARVDARLLGATIAPGLALAGLFDLDDLCAEPRQHLGARRTGLELGEVQNADSVEGCTHGLPPVGGMITRRPHDSRRSSLVARSRLTRPCSVTRMSGLLSTNVRKLETGQLMYREGSVNVASTGDDAPISATAVPMRCPGSSVPMCCPCLWTSARPLIATQMRETGS